MRQGTVTTLGNVGWVVLLVTTGVGLLNQVIGRGVVTASADERQMFVGYAAANVLAFLLVLFAYRRRELWAWIAMWVYAIAVAAVLPLSGGDIGAASIASAVALAVGQVLIARDVFTPLKPGAEAGHSVANPARDRRIRLRSAGVLSLILGLGFGIPTAYGAWYFAMEGNVWRFLGNPTMGDGPFVQFGIANSVPLMLAFVVVCAVGVISGVLLLAVRKAGAVLALALFPIELFFWTGFALPFAFPLGIAALALVLWPSGTRIESDPV